MSRTPLLMGNWKMYKTVAEAREFSEALAQQSGKLTAHVDHAICAPFTTLHVLRVMLPTQVKIGAQNVYPQLEGAFTGEISTAMLAEFGTQFVLAGHSERRMLFGESDQLISQKVRAIADAGMTPVLCVGENLSQKEEHMTKEIVAGQVVQGLAHLKAAEVAKVVIAYEPIWAIGSGKTATPQDAQEVCHEIRGLIAVTYDAEAAENVRILYGGSVKPNNIASFLQEADIDGGLVGGASLDASSFAEMSEALGGVVS